LDRRRADHWHSSAFGLTAFPEDADALSVFRRGEEGAGRGAGDGGLDKTSDRTTPEKRSSSSSFSTPTAGGCRSSTAAFRPANFKDAISIVAIGRYREAGSRPRKLLVKCPSKYQGAEVEKAYAGEAASGKTS